MLTKQTLNHNKHAQMEWTQPLTMSMLETSVALPFTLKSILRQKKNYENSNISPCKNIFFKKSSKRNQNPSRDITSL